MESSVPSSFEQRPDSDLELIPSNDLPRAILGEAASASQNLDLFLEANTLALVVNAITPTTEVSDSLSRIRNLKNSGIRLRLITEIVQENVPQCVEVMKYFELYHVNQLKGNFLLIADKEFHSFLFSPQKGSIEGRILRTVNRSIVDSHSFMVNIISATAMPAQQRFSEIVKGAAAEFMETVRDPSKTKLLISELISSAIYEICILFSTKRSLDIALNESIIDHLEAAARRGVKVKVLVMYEDARVVADESSKEAIKTKYPSITLNYLQQFLPTKITTLVVDQAKSLTVEVNDDSQLSFEESVGLSTYSNSESTVFSNASIFESLWIQSELDKQNKARQAYFQLFRGFKLKNEVYNRKWSESSQAGEQDNK